MNNKELSHITSILLNISLFELYNDCVPCDTHIGDQFANEFGFSVSVKTDKPISINDFAKITKTMQKNIDRNLPIKYRTINRKEALKLFAKNKYKLEIINDSNEKDFEIIDVDNGKYIDFCPQLSILKFSTIKCFKLLTIGGEYWKHSSKNEQLQSIFGVAFATQEELKNYELLVKDASERDHRNINNQLELFGFDLLAGQGLPFFLPNGANIKYEMDKYIHELLMRNEYMYVNTPVLGNQKLFEISGHWEHYRANMFAPLQIDDDVEVLRPMTCPHHLLVYKMKPRSYRDLPFRVFEDAILHRYESSGSLTGLERVRQMRLIDTHIVCSKDQIFEVISRCYNIINEASSTFGIKIHSVDLSLHDAKDTTKFFSDEKLWKIAEDGLRDVLRGLKIKYKEEVGEAAFYGPKLDIQVKTALGHIVTVFTIQLDFLLPKRFGLTFKNKNGEEEMPILVHSAPLSTIERFLSILLEQNKGAFPLWLAPVQVYIIPVSEKNNKFAQSIYQELLNNNIRVKLDTSDERLAKKIAISQTSKVPYQLILGDDETKKKKVTYRCYGQQKSQTVAFPSFIKKLTQQINERK